ncbi:MAG: Sun protein [Deltaproteobacteria bacterium]|nr:Sun protein [Deltaproteobacteria bacterium]
MTTAARGPKGRAREGGRRAPTARSVAADVLLRVWKDSAFAAAALDAELARNVQLEVRDRALATELVYGTLRLGGWLEQRLGRHAPRGLGSLDPHVRAHLLVAAYQIVALSRVPDFAAVNEAVDAIRALRGERMSGFANAILRKIAKEPKPEADELARASLASADPALVRAILDAIGEPAALALVATEETPPLGLRIEDADARDTWIARLREARPDASIEAGRASPLAVLVRGAGRVVDLPGYGEGAWTPQEEGSQVIALALGAKPGEIVLDACAGRGNKTGLLARAVGAEGAVDAADLHPAKLDRLREELARIGQAPRATFAVDWSVGAGGARGPYDRVLVDAPCSGTGTIRRRPELLAKRKGADIGELAALQRAILARTAPLVRPGGRLVYAVCSVLREEAEGVVAAAAEVGLEPAPFDSAVADRIAGGASRLRLLPHEHGTDGYFVASFVRS